MHGMANRILTPSIDFMIDIFVLKILNSKDATMICFILFLC